MTEKFKLQDGTEVGTGMLPPVPGVFCKSTRFNKSWLLDDDAIETLMKFQDISITRPKYRKWRINQGSIGSCNAAAKVGMMYRVADRIGMDHVPLSENDLYIQINGGYDRGSLLSDALENGQHVGVSPRVLNAGTYPYQAYRRSQVSSAILEEAKRVRINYRTHEPIALPTDSDFVRAVASCIARGWPIAMAWHVGGSSMRLNNGYIQQSRGRGNHASFLHGGKWVGGRDLVHADLNNSWTSYDPMYGRTGSEWGEGGNGLITMESLQQCKGYHTFYTITSMIESGTS